MPRRSPAMLDDLIRRRELWPIEEAAYRLGISRRTLYRRIDEGLIRPTRVGARVFVSERELQRFIDRIDAAAS